MSIIPIVLTLIGTALSIHGQCRIPKDEDHAEKLRIIRDVGIGVAIGAGTIATINFIFG